MAKNEVIKNVIGKTYEPFTGAFQIKNVATDLADHISGNILTLPPGYYESVNGFNFGNLEVVLAVQDATYTFVTKQLTGVSMYTGTNTLFTTTATGITLEFYSGAYVATVGTLFDVSNGVSFFVENTAFVALDVGDVNGFDFVTLKTLAMPNCGDGLKLTNIVNKIIAHLIQWNNGANTGGTAISVLGTAAPFVSITEVDSQPASSESFVMLSTDWTGVSVISLGIHDTTTGGVFFNTSGVNQSDVDVQLSDVFNVGTSANIAVASLGAVHSAGAPISNSTATIISAEDTPTKILVGIGDEEWKAITNERWTINADGTFTYNGAETIRPIAALAATVNPVSGGSHEIGLYIAVNGTVLDNSLGRATLSAGGQLVANASPLIVTGDTVSGFVASFSSSTNLIVTTAKFTIRG